MKPSRGMISGELSWAFVALCVGLQPYTSSWLYSRLLETRSPPELWSALLIVPALGLIVIGIVELAKHGSWSCVEVARSARWRGRLCLTSTLGWLYMVKVLAVDLNRVSVSTSMLFALGGVVFMSWFYKENRRARREIRKFELGRDLTAS